MATRTQDHIMDQTGADNWNDVEATFANMSQSEIERELNGMFPHEDNAELAEEIATELS